LEKLDRLLQLRRHAEGLAKLELERYFHTTAVDMA